MDGRRAPENSSKRFFTDERQRTFVFKSPFQPMQRFFPALIHLVIQIITSDRRWHLFNSRSREHKPCSSCSSHVPSPLLILFTVFLRRAVWFLTPPSLPRPLHNQKLCTNKISSAQGPFLELSQEQCVNNSGTTALRLHLFGLRK